MTTFAILMSAVVVVILEVPSLRREKMRRELLAFAVLLLAATGLSLAIAWHLPVPNPTDWLIMIFKPVHDWYSTFL
jgi:hypothetical protein